MRAVSAAALASAILACVVGLAGCVADPPATTAPPTVEQADPPTERFDAGLIVSDDGFYDSTSMDERDIQSFLESVSCRPDIGVPCLADYREDTPTQEAAGPGHCAEYPGATGEPASRIIAKTAVACGISPKTLLVLLQKEQSLLTRPSEHGYARATGYGCPDTADCAVEYFGFANQVYHAAWQFRQYTEQPDRAYRIGVVDVRYHPEPACGGAPVDIRNQATANLYNYTPYQPNAATLADPEQGDACSAYGNLNFWRIWWRWFGDPTVVRYPGFLPACTQLVGGDPCPPAATLPAVPAPAPE
ncbi:hypothetical protein ACDF64_11630 [Agromyces sp. MMS24-JH15]|uniref:hypothetical protein n=1 Tax=Agromyces sp. MMS24-JH15 TaxID=3243765 RepID=UPI003748A443